MEQPSARVSLVSRRRPRKRPRPDAYDETIAAAASEGQVELPGEVWHKVLSQVGTAEAMGLGGVSQTFESGRRATLQRTAAQTRRQLCPDPLACTRALLCAIAYDDVDTVAAILSTGVVRPDVPVIRHEADAGALFAGAPCAIEFLGPSGSVLYRGGYALLSETELTPLALAVLLGSPRTIHLLGSHGVRPWPTVEALIDLALTWQGAATDVAVSDRGDAQPRLVKAGSASNSVRALVTTYGRTRPRLSLADTHPLDVLREAILGTVQSSVARDPELPDVLDDLASLLPLIESAQTEPVTMSAVRAVVPHDSLVDLGSVIADLSGARPAGRSPTRYDPATTDALFSMFDNAVASQYRPALSMEEIEADLFSGGGGDAAPSVDDTDRNTNMEIEAAREPFNVFVGRVVDDSASRLDWPALTTDLLAAGYGPDDDHVSVGALLNAAPSTAGTVLRTPRERTVARLHALYDLPLYEPRWAIDTAAQIEALERLLALFGDADQDQEQEHNEY
ncbi:hypothetical protein pclt_cds_335 [Pandoravirus celtis]|uniref:Uncharacterized protein n=1 Tax=Pandoravirus celtis TaxID=2568002 RepID=A0A4D6EHW1_9VIRU|nr:hypothetical protein pclt_cds_335 [Pandoravirus celtis]